MQHKPPHKLATRAHPIHTVQYVQYPMYILKSSTQTQSCKSESARSQPDNRQPVQCCYRQIRQQVGCRDTYVQGLVTMLREAVRRLTCAYRLGWFNHLQRWSSSALHQTLFADTWGCRIQETDMLPGLDMPPYANNLSEFPVPLDQVSKCSYISIWQIASASNKIYSENWQHT